MRRTTGATICAAGRGSGCACAREAQLLNGGLTRRRIAAICGTVAVASCIGLPSGAQTRDRAKHLGWLSLASQRSARDEVVLRDLHEIGWVEGVNLSVSYRWAAGRIEALASMAEQLVRLKVDVILAWTTPAAKAARDATRRIPIVMASIADPVANGLVSSLAHPGGNVTGVSLMAPELAGKRLELLQSVLPQLRRVAFLAHRADTAHRVFVSEILSAGAQLGLIVQPFVVNGPEEFEAVFAEMRKGGVQALVVQPLFVTAGQQGMNIADFAQRHRMPTISDGFQFAEAGGLLYFGPDRLPLDHRVAGYVDRILKGANPADLPVEQPQKFELVINLKTARALGLAIPQALLFRADRVID